MTIVPGIAEKPPANMMPGTLIFDFSLPSALLQSVGLSGN
jgi:hypothetical protein